MLYQNYKISKKNIVQYEVSQPLLYRFMMLIKGCINYIVFAALFLFVIILDTNAFSFGKNKVNYYVYEWKVLHTIHYDIYYPNGMNETAKITAQISEEAYIRIANSFKYEIKKTVPIIIYPSSIDFQENNINPEIMDDGVGGFTETANGRVVVPFNGDYSQYRRVLTHEIVHAFQMDFFSGRSYLGLPGIISASSIPLWVLEGLAEYLSSGYNESSDMVMRDLIYNDRYASLRELSAGQVYTGYQFYKQGQAFFYFLEKVYGNDAISAFVNNLNDKKNLNEAFLAVTGKDIDELNLEWIRFFKKKYFPIIQNKKFEEETGTQLTHHLKDYSSYNLSPAISPDGDKIAYISNEGIYPKICVMKTGDDKEKKIKTLAGGKVSSRFQSFNIFNNNLSWSSDSKWLVFSAESYGRDVIFILDSDTGEEITSIKLPFVTVKDPSLSGDKSSIVFIGQTDYSLDVYLYNLNEKKLSRLTNDLFTEMHPVISADNKKVVFSTNSNQNKKYDSMNYNIDVINTDTLKRERLIASSGINYMPEITADSSDIIYVSNRTGIFNIYRYNLKNRTDEKLTSVLNGVFNPRVDSQKKTIAYTSYQHLGYDIFIRDYNSPAEKNTPADADIETINDEKEFAGSYYNYDDSQITSYRFNIYNDYVMFLIGGTLGFDLAGFASAGFSDCLGNHKLVTSMEFIRYQDYGSELNFAVSYYFLKYRWDISTGVYRYSLPHGIYTLEGINDLINYPYLDTVYIGKRGGYLSASYPFTRYFRNDTTVSGYRFLQNYTTESAKENVNTDFLRIENSIVYDTVLYSMIGPLDGTRGSVTGTVAADVADKGYTYSSIDFDLRKYYFIWYRLIFAFRFSGGHIFSSNDNPFLYSLGGYNTVRGHPFFAYTGRNMLMLNSEMRFILIRSIELGIIPVRIGGFGMAVFLDNGSVWNDSYDFMSDGKFEDFKTGSGFGFRFNIMPSVAFKLDFAWPYYLKEFGDKKITFSIGMDY